MAQVDDLTGRKVGIGDAVGRRFGQWLVLKRATPPGVPVKFLCRCACGVEVEVLWRSLKEHRSSSCRSCASKSRYAKQSLVGKRFGQWTVVALMGVTSERKRLWLCLCACGNASQVRTASLESGRSTCCVECAKNKQRSTSAETVPQPRVPAPTELVGRKFGRWTVVRFARLAPGRQRVWRCRCACGTVADVRQVSLMAGWSIQCQRCESRTRGTRRRQQET